MFHSTATRLPLSLALFAALSLSPVLCQTSQSADPLSPAHHLEPLSAAPLTPGQIELIKLEGQFADSVAKGRGKAFASVALGGQSGATLEQRFKDDPSEYSNVSGAGYFAPFLPARGVFPVFVDGHLLGAVGASGAPSEIDDQVVKGAIEAIGATTVR